MFLQAKFVDMYNVLISGCAHLYYVSHGTLTMPHHSRRFYSGREWVSRISFQPAATGCELVRRTHASWLISVSDLHGDVTLAVSSSQSLVLTRPEDDRSVSLTWACADGSISGDVNSCPQDFVELAVCLAREQQNCPSQTLFGRDDLSRIYWSSIHTSIYSTFRIC